MARTLVGLIVLGSLALASPASAGEARLWACHGPSGQALGSGPFLTAQVFDAELGGGCALPGGALTAKFTRADPVGQSQGSYRLAVPPDVTLTAVRLDRRAQGPGYTASGLESSDDGTVLDGAVSLPASGATVSVGVGCGVSLLERCSGMGAAELQLRSVALVVTDDAAPVLTVGEIRRSVEGVLDLKVVASDVGVGLQAATAAIDGDGVAAAGFSGCMDLSPADEVHDLALGSACPALGEVTLAVDTTQVPDGEHTLTVIVTDAAGNATTRTETIQVVNTVVTPTPTVFAATATPTPTPVATATPTPAATPRPLTTRQLVKLPSRLTVSRRGALTLSVLCPATAPRACSHRLTLARGKSTLARGSGRSTPGRRARIVLRLSASARRSLARSGSLSATLTLRGAAPTSVRIRR